jgi:hypothetical protein
MASAAPLRPFGLHGESTATPFHKFRSVARGCIAAGPELLEAGQYGATPLKAIFEQ